MAEHPVAYGRRAPWRRRIVGLAAALCSALPVIATAEGAESAAQPPAHAHAPSQEVSTEAAPAVGPDGMTDCERSCSFNRRRAQGEAGALQELRQMLDRARDPQTTPGPASGTANPPAHVH